MRWRTWLVVLAALPLAACLETDLTLRGDGTIRGTIGWTTASKLTEQAARALFTTKDVTLQRVELKDAEIPASKPGGPATHAQRVTAEVEAKSMTALATIPLFKTLLVSATLDEPEGSKRTLTVRAAKTEHLGAIPGTDSVVRLHLPGKVVQTSGTANGSDVSWTVPAAEFKSKPSVELSVIYDASGAPSDAQKTSP